VGKIPQYGEIDGDLPESGAVVRYRASGDASDSEEGGLDDLLAGGRAGVSDGGLGGLGWFVGFRW
jgi:hypothetical protein